MLPRYRGRAPVNWAILRGEREAGATLHYMVARADAGDIVDQQSVPILPDDTSADVLAKVAVVAEIVLARSLPALFAGTAPRIRQDITQGEYVGRRRPEDGLIDWNLPAQQIHNLVRAVAPPFPGAFAWVNGRRLGINRTRVQRSHQAPGDARLFGEQHRCFIACKDGGVLEVLDATLDERPATPAEVLAQLGGQRLSS
jgi:methionyl-tRNA formyltransferase